MSKSEFRDKFLPLNTEDDVVYGWYLTKNYDWRVFKLGLCEDNTGWIYSNRPGLKLKAVTHGRNDILFYDYGNERDLDVKDIYGNFLDIVVDDGCVKQLDTGGFSWDDELVLIPTATDNDGDINEEYALDDRINYRPFGDAVEPDVVFSSGLKVFCTAPDEYCGPNSKYRNHLKTVLDIHELYYTKNKDYGDAFTQSLDKYGPIAALVRMEDKWNRLSNLMSSGKEGYIKSESVEDTLIDLANYAIMTALYLRGNTTDD